MNATMLLAGDIGELMTEEFLPDPVPLFGGPGRPWSTPAFRRRSF